MGTTETGRYETEQQRKDTRVTRSKPASEIHRLAELYKQMLLLLGNCGPLPEMRKAPCHRKEGKGTDRREADTT